VFETHGWHGLADQLHDLQRAGDLAGMAACITDDMLDVFAVTAQGEKLCAMAQGTIVPLSDAKPGSSA